MGRHHHDDKHNKSEQAAGDWRKEEKHHKHMEQLAQLGAAAAGAYAVHEKHKAKKDPEHARSHRIKEEIAARVKNFGEISLKFREFR
jgi:hypothetical protein